MLGRPDVREYQSPYQTTFDLPTAQEFYDVVKNDLE